MESLGQRPGMRWVKPDLVEIVPLDDADSKPGNPNEGQGASGPLS